MKMIRISVTLVGFSLFLFALGAVRAKGQFTSSTHFAGTFTLPSEAQWGRMTLPAGNYTLKYGTEDNGHGLIVVQGIAKGSPYGMILAGPANKTSATKNSLVCIRQGNVLFVVALEMPAAGESVQFILPRSTTLVAHQRNHKGYTLLAEAPMLIQRIPVTLNAK